MYYLIIIRESIDFNNVNIHHAVGNLGSEGANPSGNLSVLGGCISQYIPPLGSVRIHYHQVQEIHPHWRCIFSNSLATGMIMNP